MVGTLALCPPYGGVQVSDSIFKQPRQFQIRLRDLAAYCARVVHEPFAQ
jgi:hypothetical protein